MIEVKMEWDFSGLEKMMRKIENLKAPEIKWRKLFTDSFLLKYTEFKSFSEIESMNESDLEKPEFLARTKFKSFEEMKQKALEENSTAMNDVVNKFKI